MKLFIICLTYIHILVNICCSNNNLFSGKKKIEELHPIIITSKLGSNIIIKILNSRHENINNIELTKPNGEKVKQKNAIITDKGNRNITRNIVDDKKLLIETILTTCTVNFNNDCEGVALQENHCENQLCDINDIIYEIGPLEAVDFGNWVISKEFKNKDGDIMDMFRVISVEIKEEKNLKPKYTNLNIGEPYKLQFKEKIPKLESCEIIAPDSTFDRYYERDLNNLEFCGYIIDNVTVDDAGLWKIVAVGEIVYEGYGILEIVNKIL